MSDSKEFYTSQTRQTKTALMISSTTLLIYVVFGTPIAADVKLTPSPFTVPDFLIFFFLLFASVYFWFSYRISTNADIQRNKNRDVLPFLRDLKDKLNQGPELIDEQVATMISTVRTIHNNIRKALAPLGSDDKEIHVRLEEIQEKVDKNVDISKFQEHIGNQGKSFATEIRNLDPIIERLEQESLNAIDYHDYVWERKIPLTITPAIVALSIIFEAYLYFVRPEFNSIYELLWGA